MRNLRFGLPLAVSALCFLAADDVGLGAHLAPLNTRYKRNSDGAIVRAERYTEADALVLGMLPADDVTPAPHVITNTGMREPVAIGDYVVTESDGEHYYTYPADKFEQEYTAEPLDTSTPADLPQGTNVSPATATASLTPPPEQPLKGDTSDAPVILSAQAADGTTAATTHGSVTGVDQEDEIESEALVGDQPSAEGKEPPRYKCHKEVWALEIAKVEGLTLTPTDLDYPPFDVHPEYLNKHEVVLPGYYVVYADGYASFSPKDVFDAGYTLIEAGSETDTGSVPATSTDVLASPGIHSPSSPDAPTANEAKEALLYILEHFPRMAGGIVGPTKEAAFADGIPLESRGKLLAAVSVVERRYR